MNTLEFFERVLPSEGHYCGIVINDGAAPQQSFFGTRDELARRCQQLSAGGHNVYYALSTFVSRGSRRQDNVLKTKALFLDIDCGPDKVNQVDDDGNPVPDKGYPTQKDGLAALLKFLETTGMPRPMIVSSGRGLHVYWTLITAAEPHEWQPLADALKSTYQANGFIFDPAVTADSARVLRPIGTHNPKNNATVKLLMDSGDYDIQELQNILGSVTLAAVTQSVTQGPGKPLSPLAAAMQANTTYDPADADAIYSKCAQVKWAVDNQASVSEPHWYKIMGIAAFCEDPEEVAKKWSSQHPNYSEAETVRKMNQWRVSTTGPTTCAKLKEERAKGCDKCPFVGKITSPTRCGMRVAEAAPPPPSTLPDGVDPSVGMPFKVKLGKDGHMYQEVDGTDIELCPFDIRPVGYGRDEHLGYEVVRFKWKRPHVGWSDLVFRQAYLNDDSREFATAIADQGIVLKGKKQVQGFQYMLRSYMDNLRKQKAMSNLYGNMGWKENNTQFVLGNRVYQPRPDGTVATETIMMGAAAGAMMSKGYTRKGTIDSWNLIPQFYQSKGMDWHLFVVNSGFSAPLWQFTGLGGVTISLFGDTGGGKSVAQITSQSIWGDPKELHFSAKATYNALVGRLGSYGNLPVTVDEGTYMEKAGEFVYDVTSGRDKLRMNRNGVEREAKEWATNVVVSTNISWVSKIVVNGAEANAQLVRLLEIEVPVHSLFHKDSDTGRKIVEYLRENHGEAGEAYAKELVRLGETEIRRRIDEAYKEFDRIYTLKLTGEERFWKAELVLQHVGCRIAADAGIIQYDYSKGIHYVASLIRNMRMTVTENKASGFDYIKRYLNEVAADALTVMHTKGGNTTVDAQRLPRGEVKARFDVHRDSPMDKFTKGTVMIERTRFREWLSANGYDYGKLCKEVDAYGADATPATKRFVLGKDTALKTGQQYVIGVNLCNIEMLGFLDEIQQNSEDMTLGELGVVTEDGKVVH